VDADDELDRARRLEMETRDIGVSRVIAAAVREFESWLIADTSAVRKTLTLELSTTKDPESMSCREAKELLNGWIAARMLAEPGLTARALRRTLADECKLDVVSRRCPSFAELRRKLAAR
jgi:hypothetical protein